MVLGSSRYEEARTSAVALRSESDALANVVSTTDAAGYSDGMVVMDVTREQIDAAAEYHAKTGSGSLSGTFFWHELVEAVFNATTPAQLAAMLEAKVIAERAGLLRQLTDAIEPIVADIFDDSATNPIKIWPEDKSSWPGGHHGWGSKVTIAMMRELRRVYQQVHDEPSLPYVVIPQIEPPQKT